jgi:omega-hydroxy-beta-dihydromenaquinone-9 sulfotransferase
MKSVYIIYGIRLKILFKFIRSKGFYFKHPYLLRFFLLLQNSVWASFFSFMEKKRFTKIINSTPLPEDPLIIIGHWRTGSTYLHELLQNDPNGTTPTLFQVHLPNGFLFSDKFYKPIMKLFYGKKNRRPFDNMLLVTDGPQEDEFAILKMCGQTPLIQLIYPENEKFFLLNYPDYDLHGKDFEEWKDAMTEFCKKIHIFNSKRIILKNPFHTLRIQSILKLFPKAKFIHIYRNPLDVIPSTINMWNIVGRQNSMKPGFVPATTESVTEVYDRMMTYLLQHTKDLPESSFCEIRYEDLENDPVKEIEKAYKKLELPFPVEYKSSIIRNQKKNFKKNHFNLSEEDKKYISEKLKQYMDHYGYPSNNV